MKTCTLVAIYIYIYLKILKTTLWCHIDSHNYSHTVCALVNVRNEYILYYYDTMCKSHICLQMKNAFLRHYQNNSSCNVVIVTHNAHNTQSAQHC